MIFKIISPVTGREELSEYPQTKEEAIALKLTKYNPGTYCEKHKLPSYKFVKTDRYLCCARYEVFDAYKEAILMGEPLNEKDAFMHGKNYYFNSAIFKCGHYGKHTLSGKCFECAQEMSPRQAAIRSGKNWYMPTTACPRGHVALRHAFNGACAQCREEDKVKRREQRPVPFYKKHPDLVISWEQAKSMGLNVYRTGKPCEKGHTSYRYVTTRNCLGCMGRTE